MDRKEWKWNREYSQKNAIVSFLLIYIFSSLLFSFSFLFYYIFTSFFLWIITDTTMSRIASFASVVRPARSRTENSKRQSEIGSRYAEIETCNVVPTARKHCYCHNRFIIPEGPSLKLVLSSGNYCITRPLSEPQYIRITHTACPLFRNANTMIVGGDSITIGRHNTLCGRWSGRRGRK